MELTKEIKRDIVYRIEKTMEGIAYDYYIPIEKVEKIVRKVMFWDKALK